ncbi:MAG: hypothetical protein H0W65_09300 [Sphingomonas sp.]|uniref:hypothetical protein n=1 Tax=Sphingomonas sp. TaxID=28214 RepID=UPI00184DE7E7|nr:hypothetical protein [Sphingomonas sp.]MBA3667904.1 hypothetical protein [Sphingomonas sp.]
MRLLTALAALALASPAAAEKVVVTADRYLDAATGSCFEHPARTVAKSGKLVKAAQ